MKALRVAALTLTAASIMSSANLASHYFVYVGTYGNAIHAYKLDTKTGKLETTSISGAAPSPSFLAMDPSNKFLYGASEAGSGEVIGFAIDRSTGALTALNNQPAPGGPCHVVVDHTSKVLISANYGSGTVPIFPIDGSGHIGKMTDLMKGSGKGPVGDRQEGPHAHQVVISADNRFVYVPDLGADVIRIYKLDAANAKLTPNDPAVAKSNPGSGPRHMVISADGHFVYVVHELIPEVGVFSRNPATGALTLMQMVPSVEDGFKGVSNPAEILMDASGKHIYASNRIFGAIAVFDVDKTSGKIKRTQVLETGGKMPRGVALDPSGKLLFVGDQDQNKFLLMNVNPSNGQLTMSGQSFATPSPVSFHFVPVKE